MPFCGVGSQSKEHTDCPRGDVRMKVAREPRLGSVRVKPEKLNSKDALKKHCLRAVSPPLVFLLKVLLGIYPEASKEVPCFRHRPDV